MEQELEKLLSDTAQALSKADQPVAVEEIRVKTLGRRGGLNQFFNLLGQGVLTAEEKGRLGQKLNAVKQKLEQAIQERQKKLDKTAGARASVSEDPTLPGILPQGGRLHPISQTILEILTIFQEIGFSVVEGFEGETEFHNFDALNIPPEHPSRTESFDTFYLAKERDAEPSRLLRSHTSPMQIRFMQGRQPPFRIVVPGRVFRPDAVDASHCFQFHQIEGLAVAPGLTFGDLKGVLTVWARGMFGSQTRLRFRPHYFPFTEPSAEVDLACIFCAGKGCRVCGQKGWLEILGCGTVHPAVFKAVGYPVGTIGFAFGMGVERIAMLKFGIEDIRLFFENDLRFLQQFP
ncbi:MAG: phenylalanine--tRNA ligase subunit alpha [Candidatus Omnitrophica bacterium]|nr:phenylalanine--tRNA ligase subunit alpha [Candidatus Omnitrophota bacterium]